MACGSVNPASTMRQSLPPKAVLALRLPDMPILIYLHSMGALLNFETPRLLAERSAPLLGLVLSGHHAPH